MKKTLAFDTSTDHGSVAALEGDAIVFEESFVADRSHSSSLFAILERAARWGPFDLIAVGLGPGSYSGIRIAIAAATGLSLSTGARLAGLPSVASLAEDRYAAIGDARRGTFYWTLVEDGLCREGPLLLSEEELRLRRENFEGPILASEEICAAALAFPSAIRLAQLAAQGAAITSFDVLEPIYLREPHITQPKEPKAL